MRGNALRRDVHVSAMAVAPTSRKGTLGFGGFIVQRGVGHRADNDSRWEGPRKKDQDSEPDLGKPAVRDYRGASGNVVMAGM